MPGPLTGGGSGNVVGPASATDIAIALFDGVTGKLLKNSVILVSPGGVMVLPSISGGGSTLQFFCDGGSAKLRSDNAGTGDGIVRLEGAGGLEFVGPLANTPAARTSGVASFFTITTPADTGQTASTESIGVNKTAATRTWAAGALATQREVVFAAPTIAFAGASTLTTAINVDIADPIAGTNATLTNKFALRVASMLATGQIVAATGSTPGVAFSGHLTTGLAYNATFENPYLVQGGTPIMVWNASGNTGLRLGSAFGVTWASASDPTNSSSDAGISRSAAGVVSLDTTAVGNGLGILRCGGIGTPTAKIGGKIFQDFADGASVSVDGTEDTLATHTLVASTFGTNGDVVSGFYQLAIVGHAVSTDRIRLYAAGTAIFDTAALNFPANAAITITYEIIRVSSSVIRAAVFATTTSATLIPYSQYTEITSLTLTNTQIVALKSISTGANSAVGDVTMKLGRTEWQPAA